MYKNTKWFGLNYNYHNICMIDYNIILTIRLDGFEKREWESSGCRTLRIANTKQQFTADTLDFYKNSIRGAI